MLTMVLSAKQLLPPLPLLSSLARPQRRRIIFPSSRHSSSISSSHNHNHNHNRDEEYHIRRALRWMRERSPLPVVVSVENVQLVECSRQFYPPQFRDTVNDAAVRVRILTHADTLPDAALRRQIALAEAQEEEAHYNNNNNNNQSNRNNKTALFAVNLLNADRAAKVRALRDCFWGAALLSGRPQQSLLIAGLPNAGKSSLIAPLTKHSTLQRRAKRHYHLPQISAAAGRTLGLKKHALEIPSSMTNSNTTTSTNTISLIDSPGLRPPADRFGRAEVALLAAARVLELPPPPQSQSQQQSQSQVDDRAVLQVLLRALNRAGEYNDDNGGGVPDYVQILNMPHPTASVDEFVQAYRAAHWGQPSGGNGRSLIAACQRGELGGKIFAAEDMNNHNSAATTTPSSQAHHRWLLLDKHDNDNDNDSISRHSNHNIHLKRDNDAVVVYQNDEARRLIGIGNGTVTDYEPIIQQRQQLQRQQTWTASSSSSSFSRSATATTNNNYHRNSASNNTPNNSHNNNSLNPLEALGIDRPLPVPVVHPRHQQTLNCMKCAGFVKRAPDGRPHGCRHTRVQTWSHFDILCYFSRMCEAFGGLHSGYTRYLFRDSLACTLAVKHKKKSRAAVYKKFKGIPEYPVPHAQRPRRYQIDRPIPYVHQCQRRQRGSSCTDVDMNAPGYWTGPFGFFGTKKTLEPASNTFRRQLSRRQMRRRKQRRRQGLPVPSLKKNKRNRWLGSSGRGKEPRPARTVDPSLPFS